MQRKSITRHCEQCGMPFDVAEWRIRRGHGRFHNQSCRATFMNTRRTLEERFWAKVDKNGPIPSHRPQLGPCWIWTGARISTGYGHLSDGEGNLILAHRLSLVFATGAPMGDLDACHHCDNPPCVRPDHLFAGTAKQNSHDAEAKGRGNHNNPNRVRGTAARNARMTDDKVRALHRAYDAGLMNAQQLAEFYGVSHATAWSIATRRSWKHVADEDPQ